MRPVDEGLAPVRAVRAAISKEFGHDASRYVAYLRAAQPCYAKQVSAYRRNASRGAPRWLPPTEPDSGSWPVLVAA